MPRQRELSDGSGTIVTAGTPTSPEPLHRRPRTDQRLPLAALEALPLTECICVLCQGRSRVLGAASAVARPPAAERRRFGAASETHGLAQQLRPRQRDAGDRMPLGLLHNGEQGHAWFATLCEA